MGSVTAQSRVQWVLAQVCPGSLIFPWMPNVLPETTRRRPGLGGQSHEAAGGGPRGASPAWVSCAHSGLGWVVCASLLQLIINGFPPPDVTQPSLLMCLDRAVTCDRTGILFG